MNVRKIEMLRRKSWFGKLLRFPFRLIPATAVLPIISGPLLGKSWIKGSHNLSVLLGTYERVQTAAFSRAAQSASVFWDLGAHVGYYSLLFRKANPSGKIIAFEPVSHNCELFVKHMALNNVNHYNLHQRGVSDREGTLSFDSGKTTVAGRLSAKGNTSVEVITLSNWLSNRSIDMPQLIKMDIEGEEHKVLVDIRPMLESNKPSIFLSTHSEQLHHACLELLTQCGYSFRPLDTQDLTTCRELMAY